MSVYRESTINGTRFGDLTVKASAQVSLIMMADGVVARTEDCPGCAQQYIVIRGPGYHDWSFGCPSCGVTMGSPPNSEDPSDA